MRAIKLEKVEWDFRRLVLKIHNQDVLRRVMKYEYARENSEFCGRFQEWRSQRLPAEVDLENLPDRCGVMTIADVLGSNFDGLSDSTKAKLLEQCPIDPHWSDFLWLIYYPEFPAPYRGRRTDGIPSRMAAGEPLCVQIVPVWEKLNKLPFTIGIEVQYKLLIPWERFSLRRIKTDLCRWVDQEHKALKKAYDGKIHVVDRRGKEGPISYLKWLAAWRLQKNEQLGYEDLQTAIRSHKQKELLPNEPRKLDVLPIFSKKQDWQRAIKRAEEFFDELTF